MRQERRKELWAELDRTLSDTGRTGLGELPLDQTLRAAALYRMASRDLALARSERLDPDLVAYLNRLLTRAHSQVYRIRPERRESVLAFFTHGFPGALRRHSGAFLLSMIFFVLVVVASYSAVRVNPELAESLFYKDMIEFESYRLEREAGEYKGNFTFSQELSPLVAARIITNNIRVAINMFAAGICFGVLTLYMVFFNGLMVGTLAAVTVNYGHGFDFISLIATHGVLELTALIIAATGGLLLGWALISGGELPRMHRLKLIAPDACRLLGGAACFLLVAGVIEGFVTPHFGPLVRMYVAAGSGLAMVTYLSWFGWLSPSSGGTGAGISTSS